MLGGRASLENPTTSLSDPDVWLWDAFGASASSSGVRVSRETALKYSAFWRGLNMISTDVGKTPLVIFKRRGENKERDTNHPAYHLLLHDANEMYTARVLKQTLTGHVKMLGNGYAYIERDGAGRPMWLAVLDPTTTYPVRAEGRLWYVVKAGTEDRRLDASSVLHIHGWGFDGLQGYSVLTKAAESLGLGLAMQEYAARHFKSFARPGVVLEHPSKLSDEAEARLRNGWARMHAGLENAHKTTVLQEGMKATVLSINPEESQLIQSRVFGVRDVANWLGVPSNKLGDPSRTAYASLEQENQSYLDDALDGTFSAWEDECRSKLLSEAEKQADSHIVEFNRQALIRTNMKDRYMAFKIAVGQPWMLPNEVRAKENMNALTDEELAELPGAPGTAPKEEPPPEPPPQDGDNEPPPKDDDDDQQRACEQLLREKCVGMVRRLGLQLKRAQRGGLGAVATWIVSCRRENAETIRAAIGPVLALANRAGMVGRIADDIVLSVIDLSDVDDAETRLTQLETDCTDRIIGLVWPKEF